MKKEINVNHLKVPINEYIVIDSIGIEKNRENNLVNTENNNKNINLTELDKKLEEGEIDIKNNKIYNARKVFKELREKYGY
ncbi:MAG: hypothetical protein J6A89_00265 [Clostridia bacterium]|nr:hypothetical protein [Clostridia bacterium]